MWCFACSGGGVVPVVFGGASVVPCMCSGGGVSRCTCTSSRPVRISRIPFIHNKNTGCMDSPKGITTSYMYMYFRFAVEVYMNFLQLSLIRFESCIWVF